MAKSALQAPTHYATRRINDNTVGGSFMFKDFGQWVLLEPMTHHNTPSGDQGRSWELWM